MRRLLAGLVLVSIAAPLAAQRGTGVTRMPAPGTIGFPRPGFIDPGYVERRPVVPRHTGPIPFPPEERQWLKVETAHFIVISALNDNATRAAAHDLEKLTALLTRASAYFRVHPMRTRVFLFAERRIAQPYFDAVRGARVDASGITLRHDQGSTMLINTTARGGDVLTPRHELVHDLLHREDRPLPLWIEEGLAEYYSNGGLPVREHVSRLRGRLRMPFEDMFAARMDDQRSWTFDYYAQSWATVAALMRRNRAAFFPFLDDVHLGMNQAEAIQKHFGLTLRELEGALRKAGAPASSLLLDSAPPASVQPVKLTYADVLFELGELLARVPNGEADAERHLYKARKLLLDAGIPRADALAREGKLVEAAKILRDLAPKMPAKTRANLETQAARLETLAQP